MITVDCKDVSSIKNELLVYVSDQVAAIPTIKNHQFTLSMFDDGPVDTSVVISSIKEFLDSIGEGNNFAVIMYNDVIAIRSITGKSIDREPSTTQPGLFSCAHCGFITRFEIEYHNHLKLHYI
ncbi:MAG: C2H2-type zinc finger protein [Nitrosarchaeum sp.]|nr:C2H2-type zinc finger protein [Nitrosarchaeum sp.]MCA9819616.1 C2H2-type zinc finger protein [Nitrosarchaeum sp.]